MSIPIIKRKKVKKILVYILVFMVGAMIGSFLNVCIYRIPENRSIVKPRSYCPSCKNNIKWYCNIPIISYIILKGKCLTCDNKIPLRYIIVEIISGIFFVVGVYKYGFTLYTLKFIIFTSILLVLSFIDLSYYFLPDILTFILMTVGVIFSVFTGITLEAGLIGASIYAFLFFILSGYGEMFFKKEVMGMGDAKLATGIGAFIGYNGFFKLYLFLLTSFTLGAVVGLTLIALKLKSRKDMIPFGPFLALSAVIMFLAY